MLVPPTERSSRPAREDAGMNIPSPEALLDRVRSLSAAGPLLAALGDAEGVYLVGGAVRDLLTGDEPLDLDLVLEGDPGELAARLGGPAHLYDRFGTSSVTVDGFRYDIARARRETYPYPGALPIVVPASLGEDLRRRDFTVNAAAISLGGPGRGSLEAVPWTREDVDARRLRVLHDAGFLDDPTRLLRLARYASRLEFAIEPDTLGLALAAVRGGALATVSGPRIGAELRLLSREPDPLAGLSCARELGLDVAIHPDFGLNDPVLARRAFALLPSDGDPSELALALASLGVEARELSELLDALAFEAGERDAILAAAQRAGELSEALRRARLPSEIADAVGGGSPELVAIAGALGAPEAARRWLQSLRHVRLQIGGRDLLAAGIAAGPAVGRGLGAALAAKRDGRASGREQELAEAVRAARGNV
jgi:tRNA nucleotidyltransferase (CCA-adding enzyme)